MSGLGNVLRFKIGRAMAPLVPADPVMKLSALSGITSSDGLVSAWADSVGSAVASQAAGASQPSVVDTAYGPALSFDGTQFLEVTGAPSIGDDFSILVVFDSSSTARQSLLGHNNTSNAFGLEFNLQSGTVLAHKNGLTVAQSPELPEFSVPSAVTYHHRGATINDNGWDANGVVNIGQTVSVAASFSAQPSHRYIGQRGRRWNAEIYRAYLRDVAFQAVASMDIAYATFTQRIFGYVSGAHSARVGWRVKPRRQESGAERLQVAAFAWHSILLDHHPMCA
jgi:hypothetical protein